MLCENCKEREANVKYTQIVNGVKKEMHLCDKCSKELGITGMDFNIPINFTSFFGDLLNEYDNGFMPLLTEQKVLKCSKCNTTYDDFIENGKFGCANCYEAFSENISPILKRLHGNNQYIGRKISYNKKTENVKSINEENKKPKEDKILKLKQELKEKIKEEKYEEAAKIRDEIKKTEEK